MIKILEKKTVCTSLKLCILIVVLLTITQCAAEVTPAPNLPDDVLGLKIGMSKDDAEKRLREIGELKEEMEKRQQVWNLKNEPHFNSLAIGYNRDNQIRYVTAFSEEGKVKERLRFSAVGDITKSQQEVTDPHHRYTWEVPTSDGRPAYIVSVYGANKEFLTMYSLAEMPNSNIPQKESEEE